VRLLENLFDLLMPFPTVYLTSAGARAGAPVYGQMVLLRPCPHSPLAPWRLSAFGATLPSYLRSLEPLDDANSRQLVWPSVYCPAVDMKIELVIVPVSDVDRAKKFYVEKVGFHVDHDQRVTEGLRFVQLTPPGSACSIAFGEGISDMPPGSLRALQAVVPDAHAIHDELAGRGVGVSDVDVQPWGSFVYFDDPDGNRWSLQQLPARE
jgi:catechol 2,3-dioxygenase-like lactoylglutathione lyase family enzyme